MAKRVKRGQTVRLDPDLWLDVETYGQEHHLSRSAVLAKGARQLLKVREADAVAKAERILLVLDLEAGDGMFKGVIRDIILE